MNAVTAGFGTNINHWIARACCGRAENTIAIGKANRHGINQNIAVIGFVEIDLAANGWNADAIAIAANARYNAANKMAGFFMLSRAKPKRV